MLIIDVVIMTTTVNSVILFYFIQMNGNAKLIDKHKNVCNVYPPTQINTCVSLFKVILNKMYFDGC